MVPELFPAKVEKSKENHYCHSYNIPIRQDKWFRIIIIVQEELRIPLFVDDMAFDKGKSRERNITIRELSDIEEHKTYSHKLYI